MVARALVGTQRPICTQAVELVGIALDEIEQRLAALEASERPSARTLSRAAARLAQLGGSRSP